MKKTYLIIAALAAFSFAGCNAAESAKDKAQDAANKVEEGASDALDDAAQAMEDVMDEVDEAAEDAFGGGLSDDEVNEILKGDG